MDRLHRPTLPHAKPRKLHNLLHFHVGTTDVQVDQVRAEVDEGAQSTDQLVVDLGAWRG